MQTVLVVPDRSDEELFSLRYAFEMVPDARFVVLHVVDPRTSPREYFSVPNAVRWLTNRQQRVHDREASVTEFADQHALSVSNETAYGRTAAKVIEHVEKGSFDQIVIGRPNLSKSRRNVFASVPQRVLREVSIPVTVVSARDTQPEPGGIESVLIPVDGSKRATAALEFACESFPTAKLTALHVKDFVAWSFEQSDVETWDETEQGELLQWQRSLESNSEKLLTGAEQVASQSGCTLKTANRPGVPDEEILRYVEENDVDHVCMGRTGRSGEERIQRFLIGSTTEDVLQECQVPLTVVPTRS